MNIINTYSVPYPDLDRTGASFLVVLTHGTGGYKVYSGLVRLPEPSSGEYEARRQHAAERIALLGSPESYERARTFFPNIGAEEYRR